jgi:hypothetical protein
VAGLKVLTCQWLVPEAISRGDEIWQVLIRHLMPMIEGRVWNAEWPGPQIGIGRSNHALRERACGHHSCLGTSNDTREPMAEPFREKLRDRPCLSCSYRRE